MGVFPTVLSVKIFLLVLYEGVFMLDSGFMPVLSELGLTETIKTRDVLLPLGRKHRCDFTCVIYIAYIMHLAYCNDLLLVT